MSLLRFFSKEDAPQPKRPRADSKNDSHQINDSASDSDSDSKRSATAVSASESEQSSVGSHQSSSGGSNKQASGFKGNGLREGSTG